MTDQAEAARGELEDALSRLGVAQILIETQVDLRMRQAIRRDDRMSDLLTPALDWLDEISKAIASAQSQLGMIWEERHDA
jgi:hypothetical protein